MSHEQALEKIVSEFMLHTCRLRPKPTQHGMLALYVCTAITDRQSSDDVDVYHTPLITGSVAEFYIEPMLPLVGDIDIMFHSNTDLAIPRAHSPPTQLPAEFHKCSRIFEIVDSHFPGYVYLLYRYVLTECTEEGEYNAVEIDGEMCLSNGGYDDTQLGVRSIHGPALVLVPDKSPLSIDEVYCVRCLVWPSQAADWPTRHRDYDWPDSATVDRVVSNGCDVVQVAHRQCRQNESMWRLSFSRAEIVLINSWIPVQQIVYHMLRYFIKTELLTDSTDNSEAGKLSNYHIKTHMLWASELKATSWWTQDVNVVRICVQMLHILAEILTEALCQHYFIDNCNLLDSSFNVTHIGVQLRSINETRLSKWFVHNYIRECSQLCPDNISRLFRDVSTSIKAQNAVSAVIAWRLRNSLFNSWHLFHAAQYQIAVALYYTPLTTRSCVCWMTELANIDPRLCVYFIAVAFLHVASRSLRHGLSDEFMDILATLLGQLVPRRRYSNNFTSSLLLDTAAKLMKVVANKSLSTVQLIEIELSKAYLHRALRCDHVKTLTATPSTAWQMSTWQFCTTLQDNTRLR